MSSVGLSCAAANAPTRLVSRVAAPAMGGAVAVRAALDRAFRMPADDPPAGPAGLMQNLGKVVGFVLAFLAGRCLTSEGELNVAKAPLARTGHLPFRPEALRLLRRHDEKRRSVVQTYQLPFPGQQVLAIPRRPECLGPTSGGQAAAARRRQPTAHRPSRPAMNSPAVWGSGTAVTTSRKLA